MKKRRIIGAAAALAVLFLLGGCMARPQEQLPVHPQENSAADGLPADSRGDLSAANGSASEQSPEPAGSDVPIRREPEEEEKPAAEKTPETAGPAGEQGQTQPAAPVCTLSISCASVLDHMDQLDGAKKDLIPADGWLLPAVQVEFQAGESVFDVLKRACRDNKLHMEFSNTPVYHSAYIEGIGNLYEFDCGDGSGWMYSVNGQFPNYGCSQYSLKEGDTVAWVYTCDYGADVGGQYTESGEVQG